MRVVVFLVALSTIVIADKKVVEDKNVLTSKGPATAICFALEIVKKFVGEDTYNQLKSGLLADFC